MSTLFLEKEKEKVLIKQCYKLWKLTLAQLKKVTEKWVLVTSASKISDDYIRDLGFNFRLHQKLIGVLVW